MFQLHLPDEDVNLLMLLLICFQLFLPSRFAGFVTMDSTAMRDAIKKSISRLSSSSTNFSVSRFGASDL